MMENYILLGIALCLIGFLFIFLLDRIYFKVVAVHNQIYYLEHQLNEIKKIKRIHITQVMCEPRYPELILNNELD